MGKQFRRPTLILVTVLFLTLLAGLAPPGGSALAGLSSRLAAQARNPPARRTATPPRRTPTPGPTPARRPPGDPAAPTPNAGPHGAPAPADGDAGRELRSAPAYGDSERFGRELPECALPGVDPGLQGCRAGRLDQLSERRQRPG